MFYDAYRNAVKIILDIDLLVDLAEGCLKELEKGVKSLPTERFSVDYKTRIRCLNSNGGKLLHRLLPLMDQYEGLDKKPQKRIKWALPGGRKAAGLCKDIERFGSATSSAANTVQT